MTMILMESDDDDDDDDDNCDSNRGKTGGGGTQGHDYASESKHLNSTPNLPPTYLVIHIVYMGWGPYNSLVA